MLISGISHYSKVGIFFSKFCVIKDITNWWKFFYDAKSGKYQSQKQPFLSTLSHYNLWGSLLPPSWSHRAGSLNIIDRC